MSDHGSARAVLCLWGPVRVEVDGTSVAPGGPRERTVLAALALAAGRPVSVDRLTDWLWSGQPPDSARKSVQNAVLRLRRRLAPTGLSIEYVGNGYLLRLGSVTLDIDTASDLADTSEPLEQTVATTVQRTAAARLVEARVAGAEVRLAHLVESDPTTAASDLVLLVDQHPLRESLWALLMRAHYRAGRTAEALETYRRARAVLASELGIEPGPALRALQRAVLGHDPALLADHATTGRALVGDAIARAALGDVTGAQDRYRRAVACARSAGDTGLLADAAAGLAGDAQWIGGDAEVEALLEEVLTHLGDPPADRLRAGRLSAGLALLRSIRGDRRARADAARAMELTETGAPPEVRTAALFAGATGWEGPDDSAARERHGQLLVDHGERSDDRTAQALGHQYLAWAALERGDGRHAAAERQLVVQLSRDQTSPHLTAQVADTEFLSALFDGRFADARVQVETIRAAWQHAGDPGLAFVTALGATLLLGELTDGLDPLIPQFAMAQAALPGDVMWPLSIALAHAMAGRLDEAAAARAQVTTSDLRAIPRSTLWSANVTGACLIAALTSDQPLAALVIELLSPIAVSHVVVAGLAYRGAVSYWLGLAWQTLGRHDAAEQALRSAVASHEAVSSPPWISQSRAALAQTLRAGVDGDSAREADLLHHQSLQLAEQLGMNMLLRRLAPR